MFPSVLENRPEVVKVQMELAQHPEPHISEGSEVVEKIAMLQRRLFNIIRVNTISPTIRRGFVGTAFSCINFMRNHSIYRASSCISSLYPNIVTMVL